MPSNKSDICYLCGKPLSIAECNDDHVPPIQLYSKEVRVSQNLSHPLLLRTHKKCNESYSLDEQYFVHTFIPMAIGSVAGTSLWNEIRGKYLKGKYLPLRQRALSEFEERPSGLMLPSGKVIKRFNADRVWGVVWKITRGLFLDKFHTFLPQDTPRGFELVGPGEQPPEWFELVRSQPSLGTYPSVFDYKYVKLEYPDDPKVLHTLAMLFWDRLIMVTTFEDPSCKREKSEL